MAIAQGNIELLENPVAQELLKSTRPAQLAYTGTNHKPRVVPIWFHWNGEEIVLGTPLAAPKVEALKRNPEVAVSIDGDNWPYKVLQVRGRARLEELDDVSPEYAESARRYFGSEQGAAWVAQIRQMGKQRMYRISVRPQWVAVLDFVTRFPRALA